MRQFVKSVGFGLLLTAFAVHSLFLGWIISDEKRLREARAQILSKYSSLALRILDVRVELSSRLTAGSGSRVFRGSFPGEYGVEAPGRLIVSNHWGYLDALVIAATLPCAFVTSEEVAEAPVLGLLSRLGGCVFVERRRRARLGAEADQIARVLAMGIHVVAFPEGTSTAGDRVLPFKSLVFESAIRAATSVIPLGIGYQVGTGALEPQERDSIAYYGEMKMRDHLPRLLGLSDICARLELTDPINHRSGRADRKEARDAAWKAVSESAKRLRSLRSGPSFGRWGASSSYVHRARTQDRVRDESRKCRE